MPNLITASGLQTSTRDELIQKYTDGMKAIYGNDINLDQDSPDGQQMNLIVQMILDELDLIREVYNSFDPDNAMGVTLDRRIAYNGIQRLGGTYSIENIEIVASQQVTLNGLDQVDEADAYTIADDEGNEWVLLDTVANTGTFTAQFRAKNIGAVNSTINTITNPVTVILGVESVNNPTPLIELGVDQESDYKAKIRRQKSVSKSSSGFLPSLYAELQEVTGITEVKIYENKGSGIDSNGVPGHCIWVIVSGVVNDADIAEAIYRKRNSGCNMKGNESYTIIEVDGNPFVVNWDYVSLEEIYIKFNVKSIDGNTPVDVAKIQTELPQVFTTSVSQEININELVTKVNEIEPNALVTGEGFSFDNVAFTDTISPSTKDKKLVVTSAKIAITDIT